MKKMMNVMMIAMMAMLMGTVLTSCGGDSTEEDEKGTHQSAHASDPKGMVRIDVAFSGAVSEWEGEVDFFGDYNGGVIAPDLYEDGTKLKLTLGSWRNKELRSYSIYSPNSPALGFVTSLYPKGRAKKATALVVMMKAYVGGELVKQKSLTMETSSIISFGSVKSDKDTVIDDNGNRREF